MGKPTADLDQRTIRDFGDQWTAFTDNTGFYGSQELFGDYFGPLLALDELQGKRVAEIGSGTGRIAQMLLNAGAAHVTALEPSRAFEVLVGNLEEAGNRVECVRASGERLPLGKFDLVFSIGVLHHIADPLPVAKRALAALGPKGRFVIWVYGREGNGLYLALLRPLRAVTTRLPLRVVAGLATLLNWALGAYIAIARRVPVPLRSYSVHVLGKLDRGKRRLVIVDQLLPAYAKYYARAEVLDLLESAGFEDVQLYHRRGYSWTAIGTRP